MEKEILTDEQLWLLCEEEEKKKRIIISQDSNKEKVIDWEYEQMAWNKWSPNNFK